MDWLISSCPKCGGSMFEEEDEYGSCYTCLSCGKTIAKEGNEMVENIPKATVFCTTEDTPTNTVPPKPTGRMPLSRYYNEHKKRIIDDYKSTGFMATVRKWQMSTAGLHKLLHQWGVTLNKSRVKPDKSPSITVNNDHLRGVIKAGTPLESGQAVSKLETIRVEIPVDKPSLPVFSDTWPESVQLKWLDVYERLYVVTGVG